jgi:succinate dehydrogenase/fumarate reductase flavoprotein subunit
MTAALALDASAHRTFDVVVVGGGGAGLAAAIEARAAGGTVVLLEKNAALGGSTAWSVGSITASDTPHQRRQGIDDRPQDHWRDMAGFNGTLDNRDNPELRRVLADAMPDTFRWLLGHGIRFFGPVPEPPHTKPRMHNVLPGSRSFIARLERAARKAGVEVRTATRAVSVMHTKGRVQGVECEGRDGRTAWRARRGVILATGDFTSDPELKARFMGPREARVEGVNRTATGDGQKLALALGARIVNGDLALGPELRFAPPERPSLLVKLPPWPLIADLMSWSLENVPGVLLRPFVMSFVTTALAPSPGLFVAGAILVNSEGERFTHETDAPAYALAEQPGKIGYIVLDDRLARRFAAWPNFVSTAPGIAYAYVDDYRRSRPDIFAAASSPSALAVRLGMPAGSLAQTIARHNAEAPAELRLAAGPYVSLGPVRSVFVHAEGGLAVDRDHRVLGADDQPIAGLFAAGSTGQGGLLLKGHGHHLAWAFASGRRAGRNAALASPGA